MNGVRQLPGHQYQRSGVTFKLTKTRRLTLPSSGPTPGYALRWPLRSSVRPTKHDLRHGVRHATCGSRADRRIVCWLRAMRAIICTRYGPLEVLRLAEVERPTPRRNQVRIRIFATAVTFSDCLVRGMNVPRRYRLMMRLMAGWNAPRRSILGLVLAGDVESVGRNVIQGRRSTIRHESMGSRYVCGAGLLVGPTGTSSWATRRAT